MGSAADRRKTKRRIAMEDCLFCKIIAGEIPSKKMYEDEEMYIFCDIDPKAPKHYLMVPKAHFARLEEMTDEQAAVLGKCLKKLPSLTGLLGLENGYRLIINQGPDAGQTVFHLHVHILAGKKMAWNPA